VTIGCYEIIETDANILAGITSNKQLTHINNVKSQSQLILKPSA